MQLILDILLLGEIKFGAYILRLKHVSDFFLRQQILSFCFVAGECVYLCLYMLGSMDRNINA